MTYAEEAYKLISTNGGFLIYAGGDDLLFLSPIISEKTDIWNLCREIALVFDRIFNADGDSGASLSLGMSINYYKYPLYEAFQDALGLLFGESKTFVRGTKNNKNNAAVKIHKASGQSMGVVLCMDTMGSFARAADDDITLFQRFLVLLDLFRSADRKETDDLMTSLLYHIESQKALFHEALENGLDLHILLKNVFDGPNHDKAGKLIGAIEDLIATSWDAFKEQKLKGLGENGPIEAVVSMLRMAKFLMEE
jgi:CRISPR-associated protein Cmr2